MSHAGPVGTFTTDVALVVRTWDRWLAEATGIPEADAIGRRLVELFPDLAGRGHLARLERVAESGVVEVLAPVFHHYLFACPTRQPSPYFARMEQHVTITPLRAGGTTVGVTVTIEDVTARRDRELDLADRLESPDEAVRLQAVRALSEEDAAAARTGARPRVLAGALGDESWRVRREAAEGLAREPDDDAVEALLAAVRDRHRDPAVLNAALLALRHTASDVVPPLLDLLSESAADADARTYVALALGLLEDRRAVPALVGLLDDPDSNVRFHAIEALGRVGSRAAAHPVAAVAESRDFAVAFAALDTLGLIGEPSVATRLLPLLEDDLLGPAAAEALGRTGGEEAVAPLAALLARPDMPAGPVAAALAALHARLDQARGHGAGGADLVADRVRAALPPDSVGRLAAALPSASDEERLGLVMVLGWLDGDEVVSALVEALRHPQSRPHAGDALGRRGSAAAGPLVELLATDDDELRKVAAVTLGRLGATAAVPDLLPLLEEAPELAVAAACALGAIGDRRAFEPLLAQLDRPQAAVRQAVAAALNSLGHPDMASRLGPLLAHPSPRVRESAAKIAGYAGRPEHLHSLLALGDDDDEAVRRAAVEQLAFFDDPRAIAAIAAALSDGTPTVRAAAARAVMHLEYDAALPLLVPACHDPDPWVRYYAARSAGHLGLAGAVPALVALADGDDIPPVRIAAAEALGTIGDPAGLTVLPALASDPDPAVAAPALMALGRIDDVAVMPPLTRALGAVERETRRAALVALGRQAASGALAGADAAMVAAVAGVAAGDEDAESRELAMEVLARAGSEASVAALVELAGVPRRSAAAVAALGRLGEAQVPWVGRGLAHPDVGVRCATIEALARMPHESATPLLAGALEDSDPTVRSAATQALGRRDLRAAAGGAGDATHHRAG